MEELFSRISEAYNVLADPSSRDEYDRQLQPDAATMSAPSPLTSEATKSSKDLARLNYVRGRTLADQGKFAEARTFLQNAVSLDSTRPEYLYLLGSVQARHPRYRKEALENLVAAESLDPTRPEVHVELARLHERLGNLAEAERQFREALRWDPSNADARQALGAGGRRGLFGKGSQE
jgi:Flp pilus assembly protein TadD